MLLKDGSSSQKRKRRSLAARSSDGSSSMSLMQRFHIQRRKENQLPKQFRFVTFKSVDKKGKMRDIKNGNLSSKSKQRRESSLCLDKTRLRETCGSLLSKHYLNIERNSMRLRMKIQTLQKDFD